MEFYSKISFIYAFLSVSIPNGMEFYLYPKEREASRRCVSIPNGMEFYILRFLQYLSSSSSFNSQRDGILHFATFLFHQIRRVSIPNGMEFYSCTPARSCATSQFQFPTGWNSTMTADLAFAIGGSFNSQRDGILLPPTHI